MSMSQPLNIIIVEKNGTLKMLSVKDFKEEELYKKCGFKKAEDFVRQVDWNFKHEGKKYIVSVFAKTEGRSNTENKYDFPPPIDTKLFFGNCAIIAHLKGEDKKYVDLTIPLWNKIYEKLFGGFEDLAVTAVEDEEEEDELANVPKEKKTKQGYLKDGFVVDDNSGSEEEASNSSDDESEYVDESTEEEEQNEEELILNEIGSELSEESYDYETENDSEHETEPETKGKKSEKSEKTEK
jgi:hypothetical protein